MAGWLLAAASAAPLVAINTAAAQPAQPAAARPAAAPQTWDAWQSNLQRQLRTVQRMVRIPPETAAGDYTVHVRLRILPDGAIDQVVIEASSGLPEFDATVQRYFQRMPPLPPFPPDMADKDAQEFRVPLRLVVDERYANRPAPQARRSTSAPTPAEPDPKLYVDETHGLRLQRLAPEDKVQALPSHQGNQHWAWTPAGEDRPACEIVLQAAGTGPREVPQWQALPPMAPLPIAKAQQAEVTFGDGVRGVRLALPDAQGNIVERMGVVSLPRRGGQRLWLRCVAPDGGTQPVLVFRELARGLAVRR